MRIPFNRPHTSGRELGYIQEAIDQSHLSGNGPFTARCEAWLERLLGAPRVLLTHSCTAALEMAAMLAEIGPGDEVIMPSYTFVSTANAFVLRGAIPVFVDVRADTQNLDEHLVEAAITPRTKAIVAVHYAGVGCDMDMLGKIAEKWGLVLIEDAAQALMANYRGRPLGSFGHMAAFSFHETKNVIAGEGGALVINDPRLLERAEILREKGTNRSRFLRGQVDKYTWVDIGSSYLPSDIIAAFLWGQLEDALAGLEQAGRLRRPVVPPECEHNAHLYYVILPTPQVRDHLLDRFAASGIGGVFHYVPLHSSPAGLRYGRAVGELPQTRVAGEQLLRLPLWLGLGDLQAEVIDELGSQLCEGAIS
jgi:dTDP-4-amino-4,6-dideoxygalactose transaminase